ncbi:MAG: ABC transporter ATP-binding protein [Vulcanimicrobiaceae bacterium]
MLEVTGLQAGYQADLQILRGVDLRARTGQITAVLGANGTGKSTLLKTVAGFLKPVAGTIRLGSTDLTGTPAHEMVRNGLVYVPQEAGVFIDMSVEENLILGAWPYRHDRARIRERLERNFGRFPVLREKRWQRAGELSGGQRRMVELGRALMTDPRLLLIDEPTAGLSHRMSYEVYEILAALRAEGRTLLLVDQQIRDAIKLADYVYVLDAGRNRREGPAADFSDVEKSFWW